MKAIIHPSQLKGTVQAPASKSSMQRACAAALLSNGRTVLKNPGHSNDDKAAIEIIKALGAKCRIENETLVIESSGVPFVIDNSSLVVDCGESGLSSRMFGSIIALSNKKITMSGSGSLTTRPMDFFDEILPKLGVQVKSNDGKLPLEVLGPLAPTSIEVDGSLSSQFLTGLLMAYSAAPPKSFPKGRTSEHPDNSVVSIKVRNLKSKPYIDLTLDVMKKFGMRIPENKNYEEFIFKNETHDSPKESLWTRLSEGVLTDTTHDYTVEGDWSGAAFLLVAGAIAGPITVKGLDIKSTQADKAIMTALSKANVAVEITGDDIIIHPGDLKGFEFDATDCPDLFPPLVALAAYCNGETKIQGVHRLTHKESNRTKALMQEFGKMGVKIEIQHDIMIIYGRSKLTVAKVHSHHDHRIAMACAVAALKADGVVEIEEAQSVKKSYPDFYADLQILGANISAEFVTSS